MSKTLIGSLFIICGVIYGSLAIDPLYNITLGYLLQHNWIKPPEPGKAPPAMLGRKITILLYSAALIIIGIFILWNHQT